MKKIVLGIFLLSLLASCASSYKAITPESVNYRGVDNSKPISFSYKYDVLRERGNKKYAKKESRKGVKVVAIRIENNSENSYVFGKDIKIHASGVPINILEPRAVLQQLKQSVPIYLLYLLLTPMQFYNGDSSAPIGLVIGPGITAGNMIVAGSANKHFLEELENNFLNGKVINAGETVYGLVGIYDSGYNPLTLE